MAIPNLNFANLQVTGANPLSFAGFGGKSSKAGLNAASNNKVTSPYAANQNNDGLAERIGRINGELSPVVSNSALGNRLDVIC